MYIHNIYGPYTKFKTMPCDSCKKRFPVLHHRTDYTYISYGIILPILATLKLKYRLYNYSPHALKSHLNDIVNEFKDTIIKAAKSSIPNKTVLIRPNEPNWINSSIKRHIRQRKRLYKIAKRINNEQTWIKFRQKDVML